MAIKIIKATEKYLDQMVKLSIEARQHHIDILNGYYKPVIPTTEAEMLRQYIAQDKDHIMLIAVDTNDIVLGMIWGEILYKPLLVKPNRGRITNFVVSAQARRQGIGKKLMDAFITDCKSRNIQEITLGVYNANKGSYDFYIEY